MLKIESVERDSIFSKIDFRSKLYMILVITIVSFMWESVLLQLVLALSIVTACLIAGVKWSYLQRIMLIMIPFYIFLLLTHAFFNTTQVMTLLRKDLLTPIMTFPERLWLIGGSSASREGLAYGFNVVFKTLTLTLIIPLGVFTTNIDNMIVGMVKAKIPYKLAFIFSSTLRFFPLLVQEFNLIVEAQRLRGLAIEEMGVINRVKVYSKVAVPLILGALVKSQQLEVVLQSKAFSGNPNRTYLHISYLGRFDYVLIILLSVFLILAVYLLAFYGIGTFGGPV